MLVRDLAVRQLAANAPRRVIYRYGRRLTPEEVAENERIDAENVRLKRWVYSLTAPESEKKAVVARWISWYQANRCRWNYRLADKVRILFLDTRFAKYWANLVRLDFGISHVTKRPVFDEIVSRLKYSLTLSVTSLLLAYIISVPLGIFSAVRQNTFADRVLTVILYSCTIPLRL